MKALTFPQRVGAIVGGLVLIAVAGYVGLVAPRVREADMLRQQVRQERARAERTPGPTAVPISEAERKLWADLEVRLRERYPVESELPRAIASVAQIARAAGMAPISLEVVAPTAASAPPAVAPPVFDVPAELAMNGAAIKLVAGAFRYRDLVRFVDRLSAAPVSVAIRSLEVKRTDTQLTAEILLSSFRWAR